MRGPNDKAGFARVVAATATPAARYDTPAFPSGSSTLVTRPVMSACPRSQVELSGNESANLAPSSDVLLPKKIRQTPECSEVVPQADWWIVGFGQGGLRSNVGTGTRLPNLLRHGQRKRAGTRIHRDVTEVDESFDLAF